MNVYPITFKNADGTTFTGELITDMSLPANTDWTIGAAGNGLLYSAFPVPPPPNLSWATLPNLLNQNASVSINILTTYVTPTTGVTLALAPGVTLPTGWAFNVSTNLLTYNGTSVSGPVSVSFIATLTSTSATSPSNTFTVSGIGSTSSDTVAPTIPLGIAIASILQTTATISGLASSDPAPAGKTWSGMKQYNVTVPGVSGSPFTVNAPDTGTHAPLTFGDIGSQTSTITQSGADLTFTTTAVDAPYPTNSALAYAAFQMTATSGRLTCKVPAAFTSTGNFDNLRMEVRTALTATSQYAAVLCNNLNGSNPACRSEYNSTTGGSATTLATSTALSAADTWMRLDWSGNTYTFSYSLDQKNWQSLGSQTQVMGNPFYVVFAANTSAGGPMTAQQLQQCSIQVDANWSQALTGLTAGATYSVTATAQDTAGNISAASATTSFTTASSSTIAPFPVAFSDALGNVTPEYPSSAWQNIVCRFGLIQISGIPNLGSAMGISPASLMATLKSKAAAAGSAYCKIIQYMMEQDFWTSSSVPGFFDYCMLAALNANAGWWLTSSYPSLTKVTGDTNHSVTQMTSFCPTYNMATVGTITGPGVVNLPQFFAWKEYQQFVAGNTGKLNSSDPQDTLDNTPNPNVDGFEHDNRFMIPRSSGNWANNATTYIGFSPSSMAPIIHPLHVGDAAMVNMFKSLMPSVLQMGNCDHFNYAGSAGTSAVYDAAEIGLWDYVMAEHLLNNAGYQKNTAANWNAFNTAMINFEQLAKPGSGYVIAELTGNGSNDSWQSTLQSSFTAYPTANNDWQVGRFNYCYAALMHDPTGSGANWMPGIRNPNSSSIKWFDEYDKGGTQLNWMGQPNSARSLTPWLPAGSGSNGVGGTYGPYGVLKRDYANGGIILNPFGNGPQTFNMPYSGHFLVTTTNHGDPHYNTGAAFTAGTSITLQDRDAIVFTNT